ncbi:fumarylacetoacetate hydrolase family protein [Kineococcus sp. TBRC 1896]|uniref:Fumarylacetoacetate hydrolase family protein n=1 Tax=Kineococcus mangrovi TaxID=1660183 RepID=A0ABV4I1D4_9ACTN
MVGGADGVLDGVLPAGALLVGRVWDPAAGGPRVVAVDTAAPPGGSGWGVHELTDREPTVSGLLDRDDHLALVRDVVRGEPRWWTDDLLRASPGSPADAHLLAPVDLQVVKACGVTFADSLAERVIEERSGGDPARAGAVRAEVAEVLGGTLSSVRPGSAEAARLREVLRARGWWSQYLEVGLGPDPEVFTKAPVLASVGHGAAVGVPSWSRWNNPEPELVLVVTSRGQVVGATLGNDVNLRDVEGRSALLLGRAKDANASSALGPFVRLLDDSLSLDALRTIEIDLEVRGADGFVLRGRNSLARISRPFEELVAATLGSHHQYPDGFVLYTGTLFAPTADRDEPGQGFTHHVGDVVRISCPALGTLENVVLATEDLPPWTFGLGELLRRLGLPRTVTPS